MGKQYRQSKLGGRLASPGVLMANYLVETVLFYLGVTSALRLAASFVKGASRAD